MATAEFTSIIDRILSGRILCPGEIPAMNGRLLVEHFRLHEQGRCTIKDKGGRFHPGSAPHDAAYGRRLLTEAATVCTCGGCT